MARGLGLATADKPESQEICFVPGGDYRDALRERAGWRPGARARRRRGRSIGRRAHGGSAGFTVGQRRGIGVAADAPRYVSRIDPLTNTIQLGRREDLETRTVPLSGVTFVADEPPAGRRRRVPRRGPDPPSRDARAGDRPPGKRPRAAARRPLGRRDRRRRSGPPRPARRPSCTTATSSSAAAGSSARSRPERPDRRIRGAAVDRAHQPRGSARPAPRNGAIPPQQPGRRRRGAISFADRRVLTGDTGRSGP